MAEVPSTDGAQPDATPVVPWAQLTMGNPPGGGVPPGTTITPDSARSPPESEVVWNRTRQAREPAGRPVAGSASDRMMEPAGA